MYSRAETKFSLCDARIKFSRDVWRALKRLELLKAYLTHLSCSPNLPRASHLDERTLTHELIVKQLSADWLSGNLRRALQLIFANNGKGIHRSDQQTFVFQFVS